MRHSLPKIGKDKLQKFLPYCSTPSTPAEGSGSESFTDMLAVCVRSSSGGAGRPRCNSARADSSLSDTNELTFQNNERLELSDGDELERSDEVVDDKVRTTSGKAHSPLTELALPVCSLLSSKNLIDRN